VLLSERSAWFVEPSGRPVARDDLYRRVAARALAVEPRPWGEVRQIALSHILLGGRLPRFFGFDRGPVPIRGGRATPHQGQIYRSGGRPTSFVPAFRMVTDLARDEARTNLLGGPSDRRFSRWYASEVEAWLTGRYKTLAPEIRDSGWKTEPVPV
jgi:penicillin amidase